MQILSLHQLPQTHVIDQVVSTLAAGGLVIFPTETTYGAGVDALNPEAVQKLLAYKARREGKPLSIAVTNLTMAESYVEINSSARRLYERFLPGPVTVVSKGKGVVAPGVESEFGTLGVRIPDYPLVIEFVKRLGKPVTATSANASDAKRPYTIQDIFDGLSDKQKSLIDLVIDAGELPHNPPSTVIDTTLSTPVVFRQGEVSLESTAHPKNVTELISKSEEETKHIAGKLLLKHWNDVRQTGLVIGLDGSLGVGKTIFTKGVAEFLGITDTIDSPTYTYVEEYDYQRHSTAGHLYHLDVWKIETEAQLQLLEIEKLVKPNQVVVIEWFSQVEKWLRPALTVPLIQVTLTEHGPHRQLTIHES